MSLLTFLSCFLDVIDSHGFGIVRVLDLNYSRLYVVPRFCKSVWVTHYPGVVPVTFVIFIYIVLPVLQPVFSERNIFVDSSRLHVSVDQFYSIRKSDTDRQPCLLWHAEEQVCFHKATRAYLQLCFRRLSDAVPVTTTNLMQFFFPNARYSESVTTPSCSDERKILYLERSGEQSRCQ